MKAGQDSQVPKVRDEKFDCTLMVISIKGGGVSLNWLRKSLNKTGFGKNRHGSPRLKSNQKESSEDPNKCLIQGENLGKLPQSSNLQLSSQTLGLSVSSPQNNPRRRIQSPSLFHWWENRGIKSPKSDLVNDRAEIRTQKVWLQSPEPSLPTRWHSFPSGLSLVDFMLNYSLHKFGTERPKEIGISGHPALQWATPSHPSHYSGA